MFVSPHAGPQHAIKFSKRSLNVWLKQNGGGAFDLSCALEMLTFTGADPVEGKASIVEKREPNFPSAAPPPPAGGKARL